MYKLFCLFVLCLTFTSQGFSEPIDHWIKAHKFWDESDFLNAKVEFDICINGLEDPSKHPNYFYDRGVMLNMAGDCKNALKDLNIAIENPLLPTHEKALALFYRGAVKVQLEDWEGYLSDKAEFEKINPYKLIYEQTDENLIIRNIPSCKCTQDLLDDVFVMTGRCEDSKEIQKMGDTWIFKKKSKLEMTVDAVAEEQTKNG